MSIRDIRGLLGLTCRLESVRAVLWILGREPDQCGELHRDRTRVSSQLQ